MDASRLLAYDTPTLLLLVAAVFVAGCLNGTTGLGFANLAGVALALLLDARTAVILLAGTTPVVLILPVVRYRQYAPGARRLLPMFLAMPMGVLTGAYLLVALPSAAIALGLGIVTIVSSLAALRRGALPIPPGWEPVASPVVGLVAGAANGAVGVSGPILAMYFLALKLDRAVFAFAIATMFVSMGALRLLTLLAMGELSLLALALSLGLCLPAAAGIRVGFWLQGQLDQQVFNRLVLGILLLTGVQLVYRGWAGLMAR